MAGDIQKLIAATGSLQEQLQAAVKNLHCRMILFIKYKRATSSNIESSSGSGHTQSKVMLQFLGRDLTIVHKCDYRNW